MIRGIYSIRDCRSQIYNSPFVEYNDSSAIRYFEHAFAETQSLIHTHGADFQLMRLGTFDVETGKIVVEDPKILYDGMSLVE